MQDINISRERLSRIFWDVILENARYTEIKDKPDLLSQCADLDRLRSSADYKTGSISSSTCWALFALALFFKPRVVAEVGTFIGRSTLSLIRGVERADVPEPVVLTCDFSNDIDLPISTTASLIQFKKKSSTDMFTSMASDGIRCDFLVLDGRLQQEDYRVLGGLLHPSSIIVLDDFEGVEKGVVNASTLMSSLQPSHNLIYPPTRETLRSFQLLDNCTTALIAPKSLFKLSSQ